MMRFELNDMKRIYLTMIGTALFMLPAAAQNGEGSLPSRSMTIEGIYNADVSDAGKVMPVPEKPEQQQTAVGAEFLKDAIPFDAYVRDPMGAPDRQAAGQTYMGLIRFGYGMQGKIDILADVNTEVGDCGMLNVNGTLNGWNTKMENDWKSKRYDADISVDYVHDLDFMLMDARGAIGYDVVNFRPDLVNPVHDKVDCDRNVITGQIEAGAVSKDSDPVFFNIRMGWYLLSDDNISYKSDVDGKETMIKAWGYAGYRFDNRYSIRLDGSFRSAFYDWNTRSAFTTSYDTYTTASLRPHLDMNFTNLTVSAGGDITARRRFSPNLRFAPYVTVQYKLLPSLTLFADATGGTEEYDVRHLMAISPYWTDRSQIVDGYNKLDASVGARWNTNDFLEVSARGGYRSIADYVFQSQSIVDVYGTALTQSDATVAYGELSGKVSTANGFHASAKLGYYRWDADMGEYYLQMKPEMTADITLGGRLTDKLLVSADYGFALMTKMSEGVRVPEMNSLNVGLKYQVQDNLDLSLSADNLLNSRYYKYAGYKALETAIVASLLFRF